MKIIKSNIETEVELPLQLNISFRKVYDLYEKYTHESYKGHPFYSSALEMVSCLSSIQN